MAVNFFGLSIGKEDEEERKNAERVQDYINRFKVSSRDLQSPGKQKGDDNQWQGYTWIQEATSTSNSRTIRYDEYREMCKVPELNQGLHIYADNSTQYNVRKDVLEIQSDNNKIIEILEELFFDRLDINSNIWSYTKNMCKFGDEFIEVIPDDKKKPHYIVSLERVKKPERITRDERKGILKRFIWESSDNAVAATHRKKVFQPWQMIHLKIDDDDFDPYGKSILESGRKVWKRLSLMEDAMLVYRISRAPERRVFYIDVGTLSTKEANKYVDQLKRKFKKKQFINPSTGEIDEKANPLAVDEDFFIPVRQDSQGTRIETLPPGMNLGEIDDVKYFKDQILKIMGIPSGYITGPEGGGGYDPKSFLSQQDIQFSRTIERIQKFIVRGLEKIAITELILSKDIEEDQLTNFQIILTPPSNVDQLMEIEIRNQQFTLIQQIKALENFLPDEWIYQEVLGLSDKEINKIKLQVQMQLQMQAQMQAIFGAGEGGEMGGAAGTMGGGVGGTVATAGVTPGIAGGPEEVAAPEAGAPEAEAGAGLEIAGHKFIEFDGGKWLMNDVSNAKKLLKYIQLYEKVHKDNNVVKSREHNSLTRMAIEGEFRGLLKANRCSNNHIKLLVEDKFKKPTK